MNTVIIDNDKINLCSNLEESAFGKTNYFTLINEKGFVYDSSSQFTPWSFEGVNTKASSNDKTYVYYCGTNPLSENTKTLNEYFSLSKENKDELYNAVKLVTKAFTDSLNSEVTLPQVGGEGILVDLSLNKVLFLPQSIFKYSTNVLSDEEYYYKETAWLNGTITDKAAICYERALIIYKLLTNSFPYKTIDEEKRNADILDKNFLPLDVIYPSMDEKFTKSINKALMLNSTTVSVPGKKKTGVESSALTIHPEFDFDALDKAWNEKKSSNLSDEELSKKVDEYLANKKAKVEASRKLRRNRTAFIIAGIVAIGIIIMVISSVKRQNARYTTMGLESTDIIQNFFYGVNNKSLEVLQAISNGNAPDKYVGKITEVFLTEKQITGFTKESPFFYPEQWMFTITNNERFNIAKVFGITNLTIDGELEETHNTLYRRDQNPIPVTKDNGEEYAQGETITHTVQYYLIQTVLENQNVQVEKINEVHTLTYKNGKWLLTDIKSKATDVDVDTEQFKTDYFASLTKYNQDVIAASDSIRDKYPWLPSTESLIIEQSMMIQ